MSQECAEIILFTGVFVIILLFFVFLYFGHLTLGSGNWSVCSFNFCFSKLNVDWFFAEELSAIIFWGFEGVGSEVIFLSFFSLNFDILNCVEF